MNLTWSATTGSDCQFQYETNLAQSSWINLGVPVSATNTMVTATDAVSNSHRFYRVVLLP